jgi:hypothetical protein
MLCNLVEGYQHFRGIQCLHCMVDIFHAEDADSMFLSSEMLVSTYQNTWFHITTQENNIKLYLIDNRNIVS